MCCHCRTQHSGLSVHSLDSYLDKLQISLIQNCNLPELNFITTIWDYITLGEPMSAPTASSRHRRCDEKLQPIGTTKYKKHAPPQVRHTCCEWISQQRLKSFKVDIWKSHGKIHVVILLNSSYYWKRITWVIRTREPTMTKLTDGIVSSWMIIWSRSELMSCLSTD